ncbi:DUF4269 domain-containing protein [Leptospira ilyithenensis]|uniref:DUF4269 domain-containing protein n=1 Tax=Leptospira ilyithenensis TaxID=2484901 RepID=A0A4R9LQ58_9LEPT|nr:DUF4269 domain-containing protein [Leptospira ilyithenensis]TGN09833.1 DUF4269 domain-containing protein [Leptospira ilyithenensis]
MEASQGPDWDVHIFFTPDYLETGNEKQRSLHSDLSNHKIISKLSGFYPLIAGTIPLGIDTENSDVDILTYHNNQNHLIKIAYAKFRHYFNFSYETKDFDGEPSVKVSFQTSLFSYEIFSQKIKPENQKGFLHMVAEKRFLDLADADFKNQIIEKKKQGMKTEPAFCEVLGQKGDPYQILLDLGRSSDETLKEILKSNHFKLK